MKNQIILWCMFVVPWLSLFFMKKEDIRRFMPVGLFSSLTSIIIVEIGISLNWWTVNESAWPIRSVSYLLGLNPIVTIWIMKFLYKRFILYVITDVCFNLGFTFIFLDYFLQRLGIFIFTGTLPVLTFILTSVHGVLLYGYQIWQEKILAHPYRESKDR